MALVKRNTLNYLTDLVTFLALLAVALTGLLLKFVLPPGSSREGLVLLGMGRHDWGEVHFWSTVVLGGALLLHIALHWTWVCATTRRLLTGKSAAVSGRGRGAWGVLAIALLAGIFTGFVYLSRAMVETDREAAVEHRQQEHGAGEGRGMGRNEGGGQQRRGRGR